MSTLVKKILLILLPLIVMLAAYLAFDPFEVVYTYKTHYNDRKINYNWDYNQTETLINNYDKRRYDSFIFGNSRSKAFLTSDWGRHIKSNNCLHYAAMAETLYGINKKVKFMDKHAIHIENCLLVFDASLLAVTSNSTGHLFIKHPGISGESSVDFHLTFFRSFIEPDFFLTYLYYKITGKVPPVSKKKFIIGDMYFNPVTGDLLPTGTERLIKENPTKYYADTKVFYPRDFTKKTYTSPVIKDPQLHYLREIKHIFAAHGTNYKVIITPNYDMNYLDREDLNRLREIFGANNVYDFSGINEYTQDIHNYYENSHFRPEVARRILAEIYSH